MNDEKLTLPTTPTGFLSLLITILQFILSLVRLGWIPIPAR